MDAARATRTLRRGCGRCAGVVFDTRTGRARAMWTPRGRRGRCVGVVFDARTWRTRATWTPHGRRGPGEGGVGEMWTPRGRCASDVDVAQAWCSMPGRGGRRRRCGRRGRVVTRGQERRARAPCVRAGRPRWREWAVTSTPQVCRGRCCRRTRDEVVVVVDDAGRVQWTTRSEGGGL